MANITSKSTKAEILAAYKALKAEPITAHDVIQWLADRCATIWREVVELVKDVHRLGKWARQCYHSVVAELSTPLFKP